MRRLLVLVLVLLLFAVLPGCPSFGLPPEMPSDFLVGMRSKEAKDPPVDFLIKVERSGRATWQTTVRAPERKVYSGELELTESQLVALYQATLDADYDSLSDEYAAEPGDSDRAENGNRVFWVEAAQGERRINVDYVNLPAIQVLHDALKSLIPEYALTGRGGPAEAFDATDRFVADRTTKRFHHPNCEHVSEIKADNRETFKDWADALNFRFDPCPVCKPMEVN